MIFTGMLPLPMLYQTLQKPRKTLHLCKGYEQTPNWTENGKSWDATSTYALSNPARTPQNPVLN